MLGAWLEQPITATQVGYDVAMGNNIYWNLAGNPLDRRDCGGYQPCRVNFNVIRAAGMHASSPDVTSESGSETVAYEGTDEPDMNFGPGSNGWNPKGPITRPPVSHLDLSAGIRWLTSFTVAARPVMALPDTQVAGSQSPKDSVRVSYSGRQMPRQRNFCPYSDTLSADSYWMTDADLDVPSQGGCALLPDSAKACGGGGGSGLTTAQRALPANYAFNVTRLEQLQALMGAPSR